MQNSVEQKSKQVSDYLSKCPLSEWATLNNKGEIITWKESFFGTSFQLTLCSPSIALGAISTMSEDECPSLGMFYNCFQLKAVEWMEAQIDVLNVISSAQNKLNAQQIRLLAVDILTQYYYWNLGDVCVFFGRVRRGQYGHFYGTVDNLMIMEWASEFGLERRIAIERWEAALNSEKKKEDKKKARAAGVMARAEYLESLTEEEKKQSFIYNDLSKTTEEKGIAEMIAEKFSINKKKKQYGTND